MMLDGKTKINYSHVLKVAIKKLFKEVVSVSVFKLVEFCWVIQHLYYFSENHTKTF